MFAPVWFNLLQLLCWLCVCNCSVFGSGLRALSSTTQPWWHWALGGKTAAPWWREHGHLVHGLMLLSCESSVVLVIWQRCFESVRLTHYSISCFVRAPADQLVGGWANADCTDCCLLQPRGFPLHNWGIGLKHFAIFNHWYFCCYYFWNWQRNQFVLFVSQVAAKTPEADWILLGVFVRNICV